MTGQAKSWRDLFPVHPAANLFPRMTADELKALGADIKKNGLLVPVVLGGEKDKPVSLLDGISRLDAMEAARLPVLNKEGDWFHPDIRHVNERGDPYAFVVSANIRRRHLTTQQKLDLLDEVIKANPNISSRRVAKLIGASPTTATKSRRKLEAKGDVSTVDTSVDTKGRKQPTRKPPTKKGRRTEDDCLTEKKTRLAATQDTEAPGPAPQQVAITPIDAAPPTITPIVDTTKPADTVTSEEQMQALTSELAPFSGNYFARVKEWAKTCSDNQYISTMARVLKQISVRMQMLAQEIEGRNPDDNNDGIPAFLRRSLDEAPATDDREGQG